MLDAMVEIGRLLHQTGGVGELEGYVQPMPASVGKGERFVLALNIDTSKAKVEFKPYRCEPSDRERLASRWLWIGNADGANSPQWTATTQNLPYLLSQTVVNLKGMLSGESVLHDTLAHVQKVFMVDLGPQPGAERRFRYVLNLPMLLDDVAQSEWDASCEAARDSNGVIRGKALIPQITQLAWADRQLRNYSQRTVLLFSLCIDDNPIVKDPEYRKLVVRNKIDAVFGDGVNGVCTVCGSETSVTANMTRMKFKYYNTDKISFANGIDARRFGNNVSLCRSCYTAYLMAEPYVSRRLKSKVGHLRFFIIPEVLSSSSQPLSNPDVWADYISNQVQSAINFAGLAHLEEDLRTSQAYGEIMSYAVNLLFYQWNNAELRLFGLIRDVPQTRLVYLQQVFARVAQTTIGILGARSPTGNVNWYPDFNALYHLIPVNQSNQKAEYRRLLQVFDAILTDRPVSYAMLIHSFCQLIQIRRYGHYVGTTVNAPSEGQELNQLVDDILMANVVFMGLQELKQLGDSPLRQREVEAMGMNTGNAVDAQAFLDKVGYRPSHEALYWLGVAMAQVARAQWNNDLKSLPILEAISYRGMNASAVMRLVAKVEEACRQYRLMDDEADTLFRMHVAFAEALDTTPSTRWNRECPVSDEEAVFYIMSGFAVKRKAILSSGKQSKRSDENTAPVVKDGETDTLSGGIDDE